jgi:dolichol-phosphate mannosyltransferase
VFVGDWLGALAQMIAGVAALRMIVRAARRRKPLTAASGVTPTITIVIPARNEASRIEACLETVVGAPGVSEVIVVDDCSDDDTAAIAQRRGATVVSGAQLPAGWVGKVWALYQGTQVATSEWVVTLDADTRIDGRLPAALVARAVDERCDLLTATGRFECPTWGARLLHPAMLTTLVYRYGPPDWAGSIPRTSRLANGQCMALRAGDAQSLLEDVKHETIEDVALARRVDSAITVDASSMLTTQMYDTFAETFNGWARSLSLASLEKRRTLWWHVFVVLFAQVLPLVIVLVGVPTPLTIALFALRVGTLFGTRGAYTRNDLAYWLSPLVDVVAWWALVVGATRRNRAHRWRGRTYGGSR